MAIRLAVSNLAWPADADSAAADCLRRAGASGVELAPTRVWPRPLEAHADGRRDLRRKWEDAGLPVVALQALLFGRAELALFESAAQRQATLDYLAGMCRLAADLGAGILVFGSPRNRRRGELPEADAEAVACDFFTALAAVARAEEVVVCLEPNPPAYGCDFATTARQAARLVRRVADSGFGLHLDSGCLKLAGEQLGPVLGESADLVRHFHASEPGLGPIEADGCGHAGFGAALRRAGYAGWVSIEMLAPAGPFDPAALERQVGLARGWYTAA
jgi:sugar phosphate isomerase/epimerase